MIAVKLILHAAESMAILMPSYVALANGGRQIERGETGTHKPLLPTHMMNQVATAIYDG